MNPYSTPSYDTNRWGSSRPSNPRPAPMVNATVLSVGGRPVQGSRPSNGVVYDINGNVVSTGSGPSPYPTVLGTIIQPSAPPAPLQVPSSNPQSGIPSAPSNMSLLYTSSKAEEHAECAVCYDTLPGKANAPVCVLTGPDGRRVCPHYFHVDCVNYMLSSGQNLCPLCRTPYRGYLPIPDIDKDPKAWFRAVDLNGDGKLDKQEVMFVLKSTLPINYQRLEKDFDKLFRRWDASGDGYIQYRELMGPGGLVNFVRSNFRRNTKDLACVMGAMPSLRNDKAGWFKYWDEDGNGVLDKEEVTRALIKTFGWQRDSLEQNSTARMVIDALWSDFDTDGDGTIDSREFCRSGSGLADTFLANTPAA
ncbi:hypothetical protein FOZ60_012759 [Perkinsus olseni]|uniref:Uncharacterized protein n=2 Tax=Perkinsus olseni TaxID=32597 RepID=A0A7J6NB11_PEROL|nr:hypothetical protein FOZ60_012759 [Perkinsus olseni]